MDEDQPAQPTQAAQPAQTTQVASAARRRTFGDRVRGLRDAIIVIVAGALGLVVLAGFIFFYVENHVTTPRVEFLFTWRWIPTVSDLVLGVFIGGALFGLTISVVGGGYLRARRRRRQP